MSNSAHTDPKALKGIAGSNITSSKCHDGFIQLGVTTILMVHIHINAPHCSTVQQVKLTGFLI